MDSTFWEIFLMFIGIIIGGVLVWILFSQKSKSGIVIAEERLRIAAESEVNLKSRLISAEKTGEELRSEREKLTLELNRRNIEFENLRRRSEEQRAETDKIHEKFEKEFENLANRILDEKASRFTHQNKENIDAILKPLQEKIMHFEKRVEETNKEDIHRSADLRQQIIGLKELNMQMSKEANNLTKALKGDSKLQGNWGEMILESVLEKSGLQKDREYFRQQSFVTEEGNRLFPDYIILLPGDKRLIVDSKVSLTAYEKLVNSINEEDKPQYLKDHLLSLKNHIKGLSEKNYHRLYEMESPDFVLLFIPIESAFAIASMENPRLYAEAFDKNIILVTPTTLLAVLKTIDSMWQNEKQKQNAIEIATHAGKLYDAFANLTNDLVKVGHQLNATQNTYSDAMKKLSEGRGNLVSRVEKLKALGVKANRTINDKLLSGAIDEGEHDESPTS